MGDEDIPLPPPLNDRIDHKRKHDDLDDLPSSHDRKLGFSSSSSVAPPPERIRKTGFSSAPPPTAPSSNDLHPFDRKPGHSGPPPGPYDRKTGFSGPPSDPYDRKTGFSGPPSESYDRKTGFSGPPSEQFERKSGFSGPNDPHDMKTGFSGPAGGDYQRKSGFYGPPSGEYERKTGFSGPHGGGDLDRKTGFSGGDYERKSGFSGPHHGGDMDRKTGFSGPHHGGDMDRKTGFSDSGHSSALNDIEVAKQKAAQIVARLVAQDAKRPHGDDDGDDQFSRKFHPGSGGYARDDHDRGQMFQDHAQVHHRNDDRGGNFYNTQGYPQSKKMDIPNGRVGVVIGKGGETIKYLQQQSGAKIQITRDAEHDPSNPNRQVEIMGTAEQISRAEQLVKDVLAEAEAGGPAHFMGSGSGGHAGYGEPIQLKVPTNKVGLIIGRGGDTIRNLQSQSGARIQLVASSPADYGEERVLTLVGSKQQTDLATELINEVISESRSRGPPGGYNPGFRPPGPPQWGPPRGQQGSFSGPPQPQPFSGYGQQPPPQPYGGGYNQPQQSSSQHNAPQTQPSYGGQGQQSSSQEYPGQPPQYGGYPQRGPAPSPSQQTTSQGYYTQPPVTSPSGTNSGFNQQQGGYSAQVPYGQQQPQAYGQQPSMSQSPGQHTSQQPYATVYGQPQQQSYTQGYGQPSSGYTHQSFQPPNAPQSSTEQASIPTPGYGVPGPMHGQDVAKQPGFNQYGPSNQQAGYGQNQVPSYNQQESSAPSYGQGSFQPGYPPQEDSTGSGGASQAGYGQAQTGYSTQGSLPTSYGQLGYGQQPSVYGTAQPGSRALYSAQGSMQPPQNYTIPLQSGYAHPNSAQQGYMQGSSTGYGNSFDEQSQGVPQHAYNQGEVPAGANNGGLDSSNVSVAPGGVSSAAEG